MINLIVMMKMPAPLNLVIPILDVNTSQSVVKTIMLVPLIGVMNLLVANMKMSTVMITTNVLKILVMSLKVVKM
jgi:hypothetical protein